MWIVAVPALGGPGTSEEVVGTWVGCAENCVPSWPGQDVVCTLPLLHCEHSSLGHGTSREHSIYEIFSVDSAIA